MVGQRNRLPVDNRIFRPGDDPGFHPHGSTFQAGQDTAGRLFVAAAGRNLANESVGVAVFCRVGCRFSDDPIAGFGERCCARLSLCVFPPGKLLVLADENFCIPAATAL